MVLVFSIAGTILKSFPMKPWCEYIYKLVNIVEVISRTSCLGGSGDSSCGIEVSGRVLTCDNAHSWRLYDAAPLGDLTTCVMTQFATQSYYHDIGAGSSSGSRALAWKGWDHPIDPALWMHLQFGLFSVPISGPQGSIKGCGMCCAYIKNPLLLIWKSSLYGESRFPLQKYIIMTIFLMPNKLMIWINVI